MQPSINSNEVQEAPEDFINLRAGRHEVLPFLDELVNAYLHGALPEEQSSGHRDAIIASS